MSDLNIILPSKLSIVSEVDTKGVYEIDGLYPGYGHTLGNSLRRIILSSLSGSAITTLKIEGANHEFSVLDGVKEDVITILLHLKQVRFRLLTDEPQTVKLVVKGPKLVTASDIEVGGQVEVLNKDLYIAEVTSKANLSIEMTIEKGLGFVSKEVHQKEKNDVGTISVDAIFTPIRRVAYEVENMRVGDKTNHNRLRMTIETDGTLTPREALEKAIVIMVEQLQAIIGFTVTNRSLPKEENEEVSKIKKESDEEKGEGNEFTDILKTRIDTLTLSTRTLNALTDANIRTIGGIARKKKEDLLEIDGIGDKGIQEIKKVLGEYGITLK
ncbi:TPA: DNA-directed RNA polymerase subunit alpha [Candidatus Nomurabacteria bacterium]|uniref:DNA-directed RNA polymerase subunit alpha n=1 Tax=Candidatus Nomurabacteria bacterium GW2011_GWE1_35_16 TaxID=1618761 RepID=A0A0G0BB14_9BACT|nr:MAG: DNA-directed RNA polymerase subunit alpha [Candidatus Nomurabacteria bacterium GW2011_GWE1_35_16]HAE36847.1 DNA-directed RNA polymerase subunit alpha [Candidatus Nomurabacteria bacterium]HAX65289.1 DNA-directed RNA polymerase subunit alpha [Candidatus Nomurabacteria bacterium]HCU01908.1 DNA-directed RNA polymerase subunit alpha [Candidatus Nomurabacteria bacterium]